MMTALMEIDTLLAQFDDNKSWDKQFKLIIELGNKLPLFPENEKTPARQVQGCESLAWLIIEKIHTENGEVQHLRMYSDSRIVRGLMMILLIIYQDKSGLEIQDIDVESIFSSLGLLNQLSPSRTNGFYAIANKIKGENNV
ncbi:MAG: SufE family protein [Psychromonas sp.]|nr:SufE family protein [Psychromonas sp.]